MIEDHGRSVTRSYRVFPCVKVIETISMNTNSIYNGKTGRWEKLASCKRRSRTVKFALQLTAALAYLTAFGAIDLDGTREPVPLELNKNCMLTSLRNAFNTVCVIVHLCM